MKKQRKEKDFIHLPQYPGGKSAYIEFIRKNLRYPKAAMENKVQGKVYLSYEVNDEGDVISALVTKGIGYGCDEEAMRLVKLLRYDKVKNRGLRLKSTIKTHIEFRLPQAKPGLQYNYTSVPVPAKKKDEEAGKKPPETYGYTIKIG